eukprot:3666873-Prymnesium_polylepis.1
MCKHDRTRLHRLSRALIERHGTWRVAPASCQPPRPPSEAVVRPMGLAFERSHTILGLREGVQTPSGGVDTGRVHTENVVFTQCVPHISADA